MRLMHTCSHTSVEDRSGLVVDLAWSGEPHNVMQYVTIQVDSYSTVSQLP